MLKVLEHYISTQGEGPRTGWLTQFVRFAGCNLRCPGWPCDTQHAIWPEKYKDKYVNSGPGGLVEAIDGMMIAYSASNICITGGEPFLQSAAQMEALLALLTQRQYMVEVFTNGTYLIPQMWIDFAQINMDWKLNGSGEGQRGVDTRLENAKRMKKTDMIKFVVKDEEDLNEAQYVSRMLREDDLYQGEFWVGAVYGQIEPAQIVAYMINEGLGEWRLNVQTHKIIWDPEATLV